MMELFTGAKASSQILLYPPRLTGRHGECKQSDVDLIPLLRLLLSRSVHSLST